MECGDLSGEAILRDFGCVVDDREGEGLGDVVSTVSSIGRRGCKEICS